MTSDAALPSPGSEFAGKPTRPLRLANGSEVVIRPLTPEDERLYAPFDKHVTADDRRLRFLVSLAEISPEQRHRLTHFDPRNAIAFIALSPGDGAMLGVSRLHRIMGDEGEFAIAVRSDLKGQGLGHALMDVILEGAVAIGIAVITGFVLRENKAMLALCRELGFSVASAPGEQDVMLVRLRLGRADGSRP